MQNCIVLFATWPLSAQLPSLVSSYGENGDDPVLGTDCHHPGDCRTIGWIQLCYIVRKSYGFAGWQASDCVGLVCIAGLFFSTFYDLVFNCSIPGSIVQPWFNAFAPNQNNNYALQQDCSGVTVTLSKDVGIKSAELKEHEKRTVVAQPGLCQSVYIWSVIHIYIYI